MNPLLIVFPVSKLLFAFVRRIVHLVFVNGTEYSSLFPVCQFCFPNSDSFFKHFGVMVLVRKLAQSYGLVS